MCSALFTLSTARQQAPFSKLKIIAKFSPLDIAVEDILRAKWIFEKNLKMMLEPLDETQRTQTIQAINDVQFPAELQEMGKFDFGDNRIKIHPTLRGRLLGLSTLLHETQHYLDYNFRAKPERDIVRELEARAFATEYRFMKELSQLPQFSNVAATAFAEEGKLTKSEKYFVDYLIRNSNKTYNPFERKFKLAFLSPPDKELALSAFKKFDIFSMNQLQHFFQMLTMNQQEYVDMQLRNIAYQTSFNQTVSTWGN